MLIPGKTEGFNNNRCGVCCTALDPFSLSLQTPHDPSTPAVWYFFNLSCSPTFFLLLLYLLSWFLYPLLYFDFTLLFYISVLWDCLYIATPLSLSSSSVTHCSSHLPLLSHSVHSIHIWQCYSSTAYLSCSICLYHLQFLCKCVCVHHLSQHPPSIFAGS